jgi:hypothetical protein
MGGLYVMSRKEKLLEKVRRNVRNVSREDFEALINARGHIEEGGKHPKAIIEGRTMTYKREKRIKSCYVKELLDIIDSL